MNDRFLPPTALDMLLLRHGETQWNREGRYQGHLDSPLTLTGIGQIRALAETLRQQLESRGKVDIWSSPLTRTRQSASIFCEQLGLNYGDVRFDERLMERSYGRWEGLTLDEIAERYPDDIEAQRHDRWSFVAPGGESFAQVQIRLRDWLADLNSATPIVVMAHGGSGRVLRGLCIGSSHAEVFAFNDPQSRAFQLSGGRSTVIDSSPQHLQTFDCDGAGLGVHI